MNIQTGKEMVKANKNGTISAFARVDYPLRPRLVGAVIDDICPSSLHDGMVDLVLEIQNLVTGVEHG